MCLCTDTQVDHGMVMVVIWTRAPRLSPRAGCQLTHHLLVTAWLLLPSAISHPSINSDGDRNHERNNCCLPYHPPTFQGPRGMCPPLLLHNHLSPCLKGGPLQALQPLTPPRLLPACAGPACLLPPVPAALCSPRTDAQVSNMVCDLHFSACLPVPRQ